jgi:hypothetical protein
MQLIIITALHKATDLVGTTVQKLTLFNKPLFVFLFEALYHPLQQSECVLAFDPTFVPRSGKHILGVYQFYNGSHKRSEKVLEAGVLAIIDVGDRMVYHIEATQTEVKAADPAQIPYRKITRVL